jgi:ABC-type branched-subunit amino acid transport system substrate-binding protein
MAFKVRIGHVAPTAGSSAKSRPAAENGAQLAVDQLNSRGVMIGGQEAIFELVPEVDTGEPKQRAAIAEKLVSSKISGVVGPSNAGASSTSTKIYNEAGIPQIAPSLATSSATQSDQRHKKMVEQFKRDFKKKYKTDAPAEAPYSYDAVMVIADAMVKAGSADPKKYAKVLTGVGSFEGVTGKIAFDENAGSKTSPLTIYMHTSEKRKAVDAAK